MGKVFISKWVINNVNKLGFENGFLNHCKHSQPHLICKFLFFVYLLMGEFISINS